MAFFDTIVLQAISRRFHRHVDDALLDRCAADCGCVPIGRLCLIDDKAVAELARRCEIETGSRVLDLGCGRGFFRRWLGSTRTGVQYLGVDRVEQAVEAARKHVSSGTVVKGDFREMRFQADFDTVLAIEIAIDGSVEESVFDAAASALMTGGTFALTLASLDGRHADRIAALLDSAKRRFDSVDLVDWTERVAPFARRMYTWWLAAPWHLEIAEKCLSEANAALGAIERGDFHYAVLFARK